MSRPVAYSITVSIESQTLQVLRQDKQKVLALVRDIGIGDDVENGNIVFATFPSEQLAATQTFTWVEQYVVEETETRFQDGGQIRAGTEKVDILRGQTATFDKDSKGTVTGQSDPTGNLTVVNNWRNNVCVVVNCKSKNPDGAEVITPHYISAPRLEQDRSTLTPVQSFSVMVSSSLKTKTMIDVTVGTTGRFEINPGKNECEVRYDTYSAATARQQWESVSNCTRIN